MVDAFLSMALSGQGFSLSDVSRCIRRSRILTEMTGFMGGGPAFVRARTHGGPRRMKRKRPAGKMGEEGGIAGCFSSLAKKFPYREPIAVVPRLHGREVSSLALSSDHGRNETLRRIAEKDGAAFEALYKDFAPNVYRYFVHRGLPEDMVEEALQETFLAIWRDAPRFHGDSAYAWMWGIARHKLKDVFRRWDVSSGAGLDAMRSLTDPAAETAYQAVQIEAMLEQLEPEDRDLAHLAFVQEMSYGDIAALLKIPTGTVKSRVFRIRHRLREEGDGDEPPAVR